VQHAERLQIAEDLLAILRRKYTVRAAAVIGSTAKGKDMEHSDLEIAVIVGGKKPLDYNFMYKDIAVSPEFHTDEEVRQTLTEPRAWFVHGINEYEQAHVIFDPEKLYDDYRKLIADASDEFWREVAEHALVIVYEMLCKARNMVQLGDEGKLRMPCAWFAETLAMYVAAVNRRHFTTTWDVYESHRTFLDLPKGFADAFPRLCGMEPMDAKKLLPLAKGLWENTLKHAESRGIRWKSVDDLKEALQER
jgi:predicted nucleotidyltransferase